MALRRLVACVLYLAYRTSASSSSGQCRLPSDERPTGRFSREHLLVQSRLQLDGHGEVGRRPAGVDASPAHGAEQAFWDAVRRRDSVAEGEGSDVRGHGSLAQPAAASEGVAGSGHWCQAIAPAADWQLKGTCEEEGQRPVVALTFNLNWWKLYGQMNGGRVAEVLSAGAPYDVLGFQECDDIKRVLSDAGLAEEYAGIQGKHALAVAFRKSRWLLLDAGDADVAEDTRDQYFGRRGVQWVRFQSTVGGRPVAFLNHHGPKPTGTGGRCGELATAYNILHTIEKKAQAGDAVLLVGDFNAPRGTTMVRELEGRLHKVYSGEVFAQVDHVFSNCGRERLLSARNLGSGGSDHDALRVEISL